MTVTYQQVIDATKTVELHHFSGTMIVACCLVTVDGRVVMGLGTNEDGDAEFDSSRNAVRAREAANSELAKQLEIQPVDKPESVNAAIAAPVAEGAAHDDET